MPKINGTDLQKELQHKIDNKTKPPGALGRLEEIALQVGHIQGSVHPKISRPHIVVFAGDHGIAATGLVNPYPQAVTAQMVLNFIAGGAAINVFCRQHDIGLTVVDAGVNADIGYQVHSAGMGEGPGPSGFVRAKIGYGTRNFLESEAMSRDEMQRALAKGKEIAEEIFGQGCNCIGLGEMGIGNSSSAALIMSLVMGIPVAECAGRGTGADDRQLRVKILTLQQVIGAHFPGHADTSASSPVPAAPETILQKVGGFEIAMMTGAYCQAAELGMVIVVDGFIATAALLLARAMDGKVIGNCIFAHASGEQGHQKMLDWIGARALLNLGMRLGEGTGAALAIPMIRSAVAFLNEMASFDEAGVSSI